jgi:WhiB family redox-sensing transcriptional regulator
MSPRVKTRNDRSLQDDISDRGPTEVKMEELDARWMEQGKCRKHLPETFFPTDGGGVSKAKRICNGCPVKEQCLEYAVYNHIHHGIWGGVSERERRRIAAKRRGTPSLPEAL